MDLKVSPVSVQQQAASKLRAAILAGVFQPGERLIEADLCERLGVSRPSIREALRSLEAEKLIAIVPNRGPLVSSITWEQAKEIYQVRILLEGEAAAACARQATPDGVQRMQGALSDFIKADKAADPAGLLNATSRFYDEILEGCGNSVIRDILNGLLARITFLRSRSMSASAQVASLWQAARAEPKWASASWKVTGPMRALRASRRRARRSCGSSSSVCGPSNMPASIRREGC